MCNENVCVSSHFEPLLASVGGFQLIGTATYSMSQCFAANIDASVCLRCRESKVFFDTDNRRISSGSDPTTCGINKAEHKPENADQL